MSEQQRQNKEAPSVDDFKKFFSIGLWMLPAIMWMVLMFFFAQEGNIPASISTLVYAALAVFLPDYQQFSHITALGIMIGAKKFSLFGF